MSTGSIHWLWWRWAVWHTWVDRMHQHELTSARSVGGGRARWLVATATRLVGPLQLELLHDLVLLVVRHCTGDELNQFIPSQGLVAAALLLEVAGRHVTRVQGTTQRGLYSDHWRTRMRESTAREVMGPTVCTVRRCTLHNIIT